MLLLQHIVVDLASCPLHETQKLYGLEDLILEVPLDLFAAVWIIPVIIPLHVHHRHQDLNSWLARLSRCFLPHADFNMLCGCKPYVSSSHSVCVRLGNRREHNFFPGNSNNYCLLDICGVLLRYVYLCYVVHVVQYNPSFQSSLLELSPRLFEGRIHYQSSL